MLVYQRVSSIVCYYAYNFFFSSRKCHQGRPRSFFPCKFPLGLGLAKRPPQVWEYGVISCVLASIFGTSWGLLGGPAHEGNLAFLPIKLNDSHVPLGIKCNWLLLTTSYRSYAHKLKRVSSLGPFTATRQARQKAQESHITTAEELHPPQHPSAETPIVLKHPFK